MIKPWPKMRHRADYSDNFPAYVLAVLHPLIDEGWTKVWLIQISSGNNFIYCDKGQIAYTCRTLASRMAKRISRSHPERTVRTVRWISATRRQKQLNLWKYYYNRNHNPKAKYFDEWGDAIRNLGEFKRAVKGINESQRQSHRIA